MTKIIELRTEQLLLRQWQEKDLPIFANLNADPDVMEYYPNTLTSEESDKMANKLESLISERGWGFWAVESNQLKSFIGFVGLHEPTYELPVTPCVEIGWRLAKQYWGNGYATEAANECLRFAFEDIDLDEVFSFTSVSNYKSRTVMERLNMINTNSNFEHPIIPKSNTLREHVLYKIDKTKWLENH